MNLHGLTEAQFFDFYESSLKLVVLFLSINQMNAEQAGEAHAAAAYRAASNALCDAYPGLAQAVRDEFLEKGCSAHVH